MTERYPRIRLYRTIEGEQRLVLRESVSLCFYMRGSHQEVTPAVLRALDIYRQAVGPEALAWYVDAMGEWQQLDATGWESIREQMLSPRGAYVLLCERADSVTGHEFSYRGFEVDTPPLPQDQDAVRAVAFWLPTEYLQEHGPERVRRLALELASTLPFDSGHAGLSFHLPEAGLTADEHRQLRDMALRYPGLDIAKLQMADKDLGTRIKGVHWLNFLGLPVLGTLGGVASLRACLRSAGTSVQELDGGRAVVTLGEWPDAGDSEKGETLHAYRELAYVLEPWLYTTKARYWSGATAEDTRRWERRFLDGSTHPPG